MAVASFKRKPNGRRVQMNQSGAWEHTDTWQLVYDAPTADPLAFLGDPLLPGFGDAHPSNSTLLLSKVGNGRSIDQSFHAWEFDLTWSTISLEATKHDPQRYDDSIVATKVWSHQAIEEVVERAYVSDDNGSSFSAQKQPVASTAGDRFVNPVLTRNRYLPMCSYSRNQLTVSATVLKLPGYVNNDSFTLDGVAITAGQALITAVGVSAVKRDRIYQFRTVDYQITIREEGWDDVLLNRGITIIVDGVKKVAEVPNGNFGTGDERRWVPTQEPVTLNSASQNEAEYLRLNPSGTFTPHYRVFRHLNFTSFAALGFT